MLARLEVSQVTGRGAAGRTRAPVLLIGDEEWEGVGLGARVRARGRLETADGPDLAGVISAVGPPVVVAGAPAPLRAGAGPQRDPFRGCRGRAGRADVGAGACCGR